MDNDECFIDEFSQGENKETTNEDDAEELPSMPNPVDSPTCKMCIMNIQDIIFHADNLTNDQVTIVLQLAQKHSSDTKPYVE